MNRALVFLAASVFAVACNSGGGGGNPNPAPAPLSPGVSTNLDGEWVCTRSEFVTGNTVNATPFVPGERILISGGLLIGDITNSTSYLRADIETEFGFPMVWYANVNGGRGIDFGFGYDRLGPGAGVFVDYLQYGLRLSAVSSTTLEGYEAMVSQDSAQTPRESWTYALRFERGISPVTEERSTIEPQVRWRKVVTDHPKEGDGQPTGPGDK